MPEPTEEDINVRAYQIWERHGMPKDRDDDFWELARQELLNQDKSSPLRTPDTP
ncbi:DUF2934 domain-containing protein [Bradyrhizobium lablabi]|uniref:DUF2934 domain-containing protein n=1 Tax=Bradyrhizobium lablabi TaxID=722472 RepID=UPI001BA46686|nr:DUF2934 domain-containing protein [Bradyrhizobium lablabi]MBR0695811.1 DUF2934 domain-containing protein [Bradyrhizobium lablabi]